MASLTAWSCLFKSDKTSFVFDEALSSLIVTSVVLPDVTSTPAFEAVSASLLTVSCALSTASFAWSCVTLEPAVVGTVLFSAVEETVADLVASSVVVSSVDVSIDEAVN